MKKKLLNTLVICGGLFAGQTASGFVAVIEPGQYSALLTNNVQQTLQSIEQVANQVEQIQQLTEQINLAEITNDILGEYGLNDLGNLGETMEAYEGLADVKDLSEVLEGIEVEDIFANTQGGAFSAIEAPETVDAEKYQSFATVESAFQNAMETQQRTTASNVELAGEAKALREAAASATDEAEYSELIDKANAADAAIDRNNQEALAAVANARAVRSAAEMHERKNERAQIDRALEQQKEENIRTSEAFQDEDRQIR